MAEAGSESRRAALDALRRIEKGAALDEVLGGAGGGGGLAALPARDRAFARRLVSVTLRRRGEIDAVIERCLDRPLAGAARWRRNLLRLGVAQLLFTEIAAHAAVDATVGLEGDGRLRGFVNAVLRRVAREGEGLLAGVDGPRANTPGWLWRSWCAAYGEGTARAIAAAHMREPPLDLTLKDRSPPSLAAWARRLDATPLPWGSLRRRRGGEIEALPGYGEGAWWVQDAAASLPVELLGEVAGRTVHDLCAAPGGKTAQLAARGAEVVAVDRSAARLRRLEANLARLGVAATVACADVETWGGAHAQSADAVLLDAPCTATGTLRRHPDAGLRRTSADVAALAARQDRLLDGAVALLRPGGTLVYSTCSLQPEEGPERIEAALARHPGLARRPLSPAELFGQDRFVTAAGDLRTLPCHLAGLGGVDGFFAARLVLGPAPEGSRRPLAGSL